MNRELGARLLAVAEAIPQCGSMVDCGCDHGYVSIYAMEKGRAERITASDINRGPLENAEKEISAAGLSDKIKTRLTDGLCGIDRHDCVVIAGMGGETIAEIISKAPWTKDGVHLILQPMTKPEILREYLYNEGFSIYREQIVAESGHIYSVISAKFSGEVTFEPYEKYISAAALGESMVKDYADAICERLSREFKSRSAAGVLSDEEKARREEDLNSLLEMRKKI